MLTSYGVVKGDSVLLARLVFQYFKLKRGFRRVLINDFYLEEVEDMPF